MSKKKPAQPRRSESRDEAAEFNTRIVSALRASDAVAEAERI